MKYYSKAITRFKNFTKSRENHILRKLERYTNPNINIIIDNLDDVVFKNKDKTKAESRKKLQKQIDNKRVSIKRAIKNNKPKIQAKNELALKELLAERDAKNGKVGRPKDSEFMEMSFSITQTKKFINNDEYKKDLEKVMLDMKKEIELKTDLKVKLITMHYDQANPHSHFVFDIPDDSTFNNEMAKMFDKDTLRYKIWSEINTFWHNKVYDNLNSKYKLGMPKKKEKSGLKYLKIDKLKIVDKEISDELNRWKNFMKNRKVSPAFNDDYVKITDDDEEKIMNSIKTLLAHKRETLTIQNVIKSIKQYEDELRKEREIKSGLYAEITAIKAEMSHNERMLLNTAHLKELYKKAVENEKKVEKENKLKAAEMQWKIEQAEKKNKQQTLINQSFTNIETFDKELVENGFTKISDNRYKLKSVYYKIEQAENKLYYLVEIIEGGGNDKTKDNTDKNIVIDTKQQNKEKIDSSVKEKSYIPDYKSKKSNSSSYDRKR